MSLTCKDCRWWTGPEVARVATPNFMGGPRLTYSIRICRHHDTHPLEPSASNHALVQSGPDFSCIHAESNP